MLLAIAVQPKERGDFASYLLLLLLAVACNYYLLLLNTQILQVILLFLGGIAVAVTILWSLLPRRDKFDPPGPLLDRSTQPKLFREIDEIAAALCWGTFTSFAVLRNDTPRRGWQANTTGDCRPIRSQPIPRNSQWGGHPGEQPAA
jgi:hypothetical protein